MFVRIVKLATAAGLIGLAVTHADAIGRVAQFGVDTFRGATTIAPGGKGFAQR